MVTVKIDLEPGQRVFFWNANGKKELQEVTYFHPLEDPESGDMPRVDLLNAANAVQHSSHCGTVDESFVGESFYTLSDNVTEWPVLADTPEPVPEPEPEPVSDLPRVE